MKSSLLMLLLFLTIPFFCCAQPPKKGYQLLFEDNFSGTTVDTTKWGYRLGRRIGGGYINGLNLKENVHVKDGAMHIQLKHEKIDGKWENTGGGLISKANFGYGYYECLSKPFMAGKGIHTSFWQRGGARPNNNIFEIDGYEIDATIYHGANNLYVDLAPKGFTYSPWPHRVGMEITFDKDGWFLDAYEITPTGIIFYDNGKKVATAEWNELNAHQTVWLSALNGVGKVDTAALPGESVFKYFRYYGKDYPGVTILPNGNFEYNSNGHDLTLPWCWLPSGTKGAIKVVEGNAYRDDYKLQIGADEEYSANLNQSIEYIMNGDYVFSAMVRSSGGQKEAYIKLSGYGSKDLILPIKTAQNWTKIGLPKVSVTNHQISFDIIAKGDKGQFLEIDDIQFKKPVAKGQEEPLAKPMFEKNGPKWKLAYAEPVYFPGDSRYFFFDRSLGNADTITVAFTLKADALSNTIPIARMPKTGNDGWGVALRKDKSIIFSIGSEQNHTNIVLPNGYDAGKDVSLAFVFEQGKASIYKNGVLAKTQDGIRQSTKDSATPGKLGTVSRNFEVMGDVTVTGKESDKSTAKPSNFRGYISKLRIYNRKEPFKL